MPEDYGLRDSDLVLPPQTFAYVLDSTKGKVSVGVGPFKSSLSNTDKLVIWNPNVRKFTEVNNAEQAIQVFASAGEGEYIVLENPAESNGHPGSGTNADAATLEHGRKVNIPGPVSFALWPGQVAQAIEGHHLRHNQYLIVRVYDPEQARQNWSDAVVAPQGEAEVDIVSTRDFAMGQLIVIKGTDVSFYIPPTGIEVVREAGSGFVREAVTLEQLEYCILLDENGEKRFVKGPDVVFPSPTETFVQQTTENGLQRKFRAIELNPHSGIFVKVVDEYEENGETFPVGRELFITGETDPIYFPRAEHSIIKYGDKTVHHAVAIPEGEGRYVLDRDTGEVNLVSGPKMFLPDPRTEVVVLRILDPHVVQLLYPGNSEAEAVNSRRAELSGRLGPEEHLTQDISASAIATAAAYSTVRGAQYKGIDTPGETMRRGTSFTPPRSIVLDTKYEGAVTVNVWPGYAILVTDKSDHRRVEIGPKAVLLEYDESLMPLTLSTGRPKDDKNLLRTAYLRVINNQVSDRVEVETSDLVVVTIDIGYRVNFVGDTQADQQKWFAIENYVKVLTDHCRSRLRNVAKRHSIDDFYGNPIDIIRDALLGASMDGEREGMSFAENGMKLYDVEVLSVAINDPSVSSLLLNAQQEALRSTIELSLAEARSERLEKLEELKRQDAANQEQTRVTMAGHVLADVERQRARQLELITTEQEAAVASAMVNDLRRKEAEEDERQELEFAQQRQELEIQRLKDETESYLARLGGIDEGLITAIQNLGDKNFVTQLTEALGPVALASGITTAELFGQIFRDTPFAGMFATLADRPALTRQRESL